MTPPSDSILARRSAVCSKTLPCRCPPATAVEQTFHRPGRAQTPPDQPPRPPPAERVNAVDEAQVNWDKLARGGTRMDAGRRGFPETRWSLVLRAAGEPTASSRAALDELCRAYRGPLLAIACRLAGDRAEDLVQGFLAKHLVEQSLLRVANPARGRFRTLLRVALRNHACNVRDAETALKRSGEMADVDFDELPSSAISTDRLYDRAWAQGLLDRALARLGASIGPGKGALFEALRDRISLDDDGATLEQIAAPLGMKGNAVKVALFRLRERFFELVRREVADTLERAEDVEAELRDLHAAWKEDV